MVGCGGCVLVTWRQRGSCTFANARLGGGVWTKNQKPSVCGSVSGVPRETAGWGDGGRWLVRVGDMEAAGVGCVRQRAGWGVGFGPESRNRAFEARFRGCRVRRRRGVMVRGGGCELVTWRWQGWGAFANAPGGGWDLDQNPETERLWLGFGGAV